MGIDSSEQLLSWLANTNDLIGIGFIGRSNVGKSSLINSLFGKNTAKVSKTPGRTQKINIFQFQLNDENKGMPAPLYLFDLPGYGFANVSKEISRNWQELMEVFFTGLPSSVLLINIQDGRHPNQKSDQLFYNFVRSCPCPLCLVFNKIDKLKNQKAQNELKKAMPSIYKAYKKVKEIYLVSAETKAGLLELNNSIVTHLLKIMELK